MLMEMPLRGVRDRVLVLRSLASFAPLDDEAMTVLAEHAKTRRFRAGETVLSEDGPVPNVYIVIEGQITSHRLGKRIAVVGRSRGVGFLSVVAADQNGVHAVADTDTLTLEIPAEVLQNAFEENYSLVRNGLRLSAGELVRKRGNLPERPGRAEPIALGEYRERPQTLVERIIDLASRRMFDECNVDALIAVARRTEEIRVEPGEVFWRLGEPSSFWLRLDYGRVRCTADDGTAVDVGRGFVLGIMDSFAQVPRSYEARAETRIIAFRVELEPFLEVLESHYDLARQLMAVIARTLLETPSTTDSRPAP
jgi:CRP-like cAMP-binding protein